MLKRSLLVGTLIFLVVFASATVFAAPFYQGRTVRVMVGTSPGGGFDLWARVVARHIGKHIPGNPTVLVENIPGAGHLIMTNQFAKATKPDGLSIAYVNGGLILSQVLGQPGYEFDPQTFIYLGSVNKENDVIAFGKKSGITAVDKWVNSPTPVKIGGLVPGNSIDNMARVAKEVLGLPTQIITGYKGTVDILVATDSGELAGGPASWDTMKANRKRALETGDTSIVLQCVSTPLKDLAKVPRMIDLAKTEEQKKLIEIVVHLANDYTRPFAVPPGTPKERVDILRKALQDTVKDEAFVAELDKMNFTLDPTSAEALTAAIANSAKMDQATKAKLKEILFK
jgi:tripartite-type tricarboxylate transporter receptor subunit TctC